MVFHRYVATGRAVFASSMFQRESLTVTMHLSSSQTALGYFFTVPYAVLSRSEHLHHRHYFRRGFRTGNTSRSIRQGAAVETPEYELHELEHHIIICDHKAAPVFSALIEVGLPLGIQKQLGSLGVLFLICIWESISLKY